MNVSLVSKALSHKCSGRGEDMRWVCGYWEPRFLGLVCTEVFPISKKKKKENKLPVCSRNAPFCSSVLVVSFWFSSSYYLLWPRSITSSRTLFLHGDICRTRMDERFFVFFFFVVVQRKIHSPRSSGNLISCTSESVKGGERQIRGEDENKKKKWKIGAAHLLNKLF